MLMRLMLLAAIISTVLLVAQGRSPVPPLAVSAQTVERTVFRHAPPSCAESMKELGLEDQPVHCIEPSAPTYDPPRMHGEYGLFPRSYVGPLTREVMPDGVAPGVVSEDTEDMQDILALRARQL